MPKLNESMMLAFKDEVLKTARVNPRLGSSATLGVLGVLGGAGVGYLRNKMSPDDQGSAAGSAARGALVGGLGGAGLGAVLPSSARSAVSRFGMRELHGLTGHIPEGESLRTMRAGAYPAQVAEAKARRGVLHASRGGDDAGVDKALGKWRGSNKSLKAMQDAEDWKMTSLPGMAKAVKEHGLVPVVGRGMKAQFTGTSPLNKALMVGLPALGVAQAAMSPELQGAGKGESIGYQGGQLVGGLAGGVLPIGVGQMLQEATGRTGRAVGKGIDYIRGKVQKPKNLKNPEPDYGFRPYGPNPAESSDLTKAQGQATPSETIMTARASGVAPESQA